MRTELNRLRMCSSGEFL